MNKKNNGLELVIEEGKDHQNPAKLYWPCLVRQGYSVENHYRV
jgi:hypothetical protein